MNGHLWFGRSDDPRHHRSDRYQGFRHWRRSKNLALDTSTGAIASTTNGGKVTVVAAYPLPATVELPAAQVGKAYSHKLAAADARATFALTSGTLPGGTGPLAQDGTISGTPTAVGSGKRRDHCEERAFACFERDHRGLRGAGRPRRSGQTRETGTGSLGNLPGLGSLGR